MTTAALPSAVRPPLVLIPAALVMTLIAAAATRHWGFRSPGDRMPSLWLPLHVAAALPSVPLGAYILVRRKGDRLHKALGRIWAALMMVAALSSFALTGLLGHLGPIHLLSALVIVGVPRAIWAARSGRIAAHRRGMTIMYFSTAVAGLFAFLPTRLLGLWLFG